MELVLAISVGVVFGAGIWLILRPRTFQLITGLLLMSYAVNLFIFAMGRVKVNAVPIVEPAVAATLATHADPLPQALVLTAIVISFAMTALLLGIALRTRGEAGSDHVDGEEPQR